MPHLHRRALGRRPAHLYTCPDSSAPGTEGGVVTPESEGGATVDAGTEGEAGATPAPFFVSTGTAGWCAGLSPQPKVCFDFDEGNGLNGLSLTQTGGTLAIDSVATSAPSALYAQMTVNQSGSAFALVNGAGSPTRVLVQTDAYLDPANGYVEFNSIYFDYPNQGGTCGLEPAVNTGQLIVNEYCTGSVGDLSVGHALTTLDASPGWYTFLVEVDFTKRAFNARVKKPDGNVTGFPQPVTLNQKIVTGTTQVFVGISYAAAASPATKLRVDNAVFDYQ